MGPSSGGPRRAEGQWTRSSSGPRGRAGGWSAGWPGHARAPEPRRTGRRHRSARAPSRRRRDP
eukprot:10294163-Alexandrium_andersonii.AAC.1